MVCTECTRFALISGPLGPVRSVQLSSCRSELHLLLVKNYCTFFVVLPATDAAGRYLPVERTRGGVGTPYPDETRPSGGHGRP